MDDADNKALHDAWKKECPRNAQTQDPITKLFWHQVKEDLALELRWICSEENWAVGSLTKPKHTEYNRLS